MIPEIEYYKLASKDLKKLREMIYEMEMSKSQNTKNDLCITSEHLTEQWKKGELPDGYYYCKTENGAEILRTWRGIDGYLNFENMCNEVFISSMDDCEIIAPVPSYEEWMEKTKSLKVLAEAYCKEKQQNAQLKKLLKKCREEISNYMNISEYYEVGNTELLMKIDEVLR